MNKSEWDALCASAPVLLDGAWGTELQARGLPPGQGADEWNVSNPEGVEAVARAYVEAGSKIILTNTFGASSIMLERSGLAARADEINQVGAQLSRRAAGNQARVFGSIGPSGKMLLMGDVTEEELLATFYAQAHALAEGGVDGLVIETMADLDEAEIAVRAGVETGLPVVVSMVYDSGPDKDRTMMGITPEQAAERLVDAGAFAIGANCGQGVEGFLPICRRYRAVTNLPLWMKANAGLPAVQDGKVVYHTTPESFAEVALQLREAGATFIGGCCGTSPAFIAALSARMA